MVIRIIINSKHSINDTSVVTLHLQQRSSYTDHLSTSEYHSIPRFRHRHHHYELSFYTYHQSTLNLSSNLDNHIHMTGIISCRASTYHRSTAYHHSISRYRLHTFHRKYGTPHIYFRCTAYHHSNQYFPYIFYPDLHRSYAHTQNGASTDTKSGRKRNHLPSSAVYT